jgi:hypothetical protein
MQEAIGFVQEAPSCSAGSMQVSERTVTGNGNQESATITSTKPQIAARHLEAALRVTRPSVSKADRVLYERLRDKLMSIRCTVTAPVPPASMPSTAVGAEGMRPHAAGSLDDGTGGLLHPSKVD